MPKFLPVKEAAKLVGKSPSSIRRIIYPILDKDQHPDRKHIHPTPDDAKALRLKGQNFPWKISEDLLHRELPDAGTKTAADAKVTSGHSGDGSAAVVDMLRRELDIKNRQIETQSELLKELSERLREGNIMMRSLQQQLALTDGSAREESEVVDATPKVPKAEKGSGPAEPSGPKKRGFFDWLFIRL